jgi:hypothetical protein
MTTATAPKLAPGQESDQRPGLDLHVAPARQEPIDATQGRQIGSDPYDDASQGRQLGSRPHDDATHAPGYQTRPSV